MYFLTAGVRDAKRIEQTLIDRFGWAETFAPAIDGSITVQRIEAFIRVREALQSDCADYQAVLTSISSLDNLETDKDSTSAEKTATGFQASKSIFGAGPRMVSFSTTRNRALLDEDMGLGEYLYIYLNTYAEQLAAESTSVFSGMEEAYVSERARKEFTQILMNQLLALQASGLQESYPGLEAKLQTEIEALKNGTHTSPWPNGPPDNARVSLNPYQGHLAGLYCSGIVKIELLQKNRGFNFEG